jgi:hypothetical protein
MKNFIFTALAVSLVSIVFLSSEYSMKPEQAGIINQDSEVTDYKSEDENEKEGPELEQEFFRSWHEPYGNMLETEHMNQIWSEINTVPREQELNNAPVNSWICVGPFGMSVINTNARYTGRILDIELLGSYPQFQFDFRVASASGGIWALLTFPLPGIPGCITNNNITSQATSCLATHPFNTDIIFTGTGEASQRSGTGLWKTSNGGQNWQQVPISPVPGGFYRIKFNPGNPTRLHTVTTLGYYRSDNSGSTWTRYFSGDITDMAINPLNPNYIFITKNGDNLTGGVYSSVNGGTNWTKLTNGIAGTNVGRSAITIYKANPNIIYASLGQLDDHSLLGVWKSINNGASWTNVTPSVDIGGNAWYNNVISVSPVNSNIVLVAMTQMARTTNGGSSWTLINDDNLHVDHHALTWRNGGDTVYSGNDGGFSRSVNGGATWTNTYNNYGVTQFYNFDVGKNNTSVIFGGTQDNGVLGTTTFNGGGSNWQHTLGGDGAGIAIDPTNASKIYSVNGAYGGSYLFWRQKSGNSGQSWNAFNGGLPANNNWAPKIRAGLQNPPVLYTHANNYVYSSASPYNTWTQFNPSAFSGEITNLIVPNTSSDRLFACIGGIGAQKLMYYYSGSWHDISAGLPGRVRSVQSKTHPVTGTYTYAVMNGLTAGQKIYRTTDSGVSWANVSGDLPNVPLSDIIIYPSIVTNNLYVGSEFGCYRTTNGGTNWHRWNNGMPESNIVTELKYIDSLSTRNKFYILAATYGRSIWIREVSGDDPVSANNNNTEIPKTYALYQNYPNPFNPVTKIKFDIPSNVTSRTAIVKLAVYDALGRETAILVNETLKPGSYEREFDANRFGSGVYFYKLTAGEFTQVRKMILLK